MIYAIRAVGSGYIKFGRAKSVGRRLKELETACPHDLEVVASVDWHDGAEKAIHRILEKQWVRGEWFRESEETELVVRWMLAGNKANLLKAVGREVEQVAPGGLSLARPRVAHNPNAMAEWWERKKADKAARSAAAQQQDNSLKNQGAVSADSSVMH